MLGLGILGLVIGEILDVVLEVVEILRIVKIGGLTIRI